MKKKLLLVLFSTLAISLFSHGSNETTINAAKKVVVGLILDQPGIGDDSVNDSCYLGLQQAADEGLITLRTKSSSEYQSYGTILEQFVSENVNAIFVIGEENRGLLIQSANTHKDTMFFGVDIIFSERELKDNLMGLTFKEQDGGYLAGLVAGSLTYRYKKHHAFLNEINRVGIILGKNSLDIKRYELGFFAGVKEVNPACEVIPININNLNSPEKGAKALKELSEKGVDIVFSVAGNSDVGVFEAAEERNILVIGANKDLSESSSNILTSVVKKISVSTYLLTKEYVTTGFEFSENKVYGLDVGAISLAPYYSYDKYIPKDITQIISKMSSKLIKGSEVIPESIDMVIFNVEDVPEIVE